MRPTKKQNRSLGRSVFAPLAVVALTTSALAAPTLSLPASADTAAVIVGHVTETGHVISTGVDVWLYTDDDVFVADTVTDGAGNFSFAGVEAGLYKIRYENQNEAVEEWWHNQPTMAAASLLPVGKGEQVQADAYLSAVAENLTLPTITGTAQAGQTLTASTGTWYPTPTQLSYQWLRGSTPIAGATAASYAVTSADAGSTLSVRVTVHRIGLTESAVSLATAAVPGVPPDPEEPGTPEPVTPVATNAPTVEGTARVGGTLRATDGSWSPAPTTLTRQWLRNGTPIGGATAATYRATSADAGKRLSLRTTASGVGGSTSVTSPGVTIAKATSTAALTLSGKAKKAVATLRITTAGSATGTVTFTAKIRGKTVKVKVKLVNGRAKATLKRLPRGSVTVTAAWAGSASAVAVSKKGKVKVR